MPDQPVPLAVVTRSGMVESTHYGDGAVTDSSGRLVAHVGDPQKKCYLRSSAKPLQALVVITSQAAANFALTDKELAICCASHSGSAEHLQTVRGILDKIGMSEDALECGAHMPGDADERKRLIRSGQEPGPIHNNCSGKHAGMLSAARAMDIDPDGYSQPNHIIQQAALQIVADVCDMAPGDIQQGVDGCGVVTFGMPLHNAATGYARFTTPETLPEKYQEGARRLAAAMAQFPVMVSGQGSFNTRLLQVCGQSLIVKGGAEGLYCLGIRGDDRGIAVKASDGSGRGLPPALLSMLDTLNMIEADDLEELSEFAKPAVTNAHNDTVGEIRAALRLTRDG